MSSLSPLEKRVFEELFGMSSGYVLDFSNRSFSDFFHDAVKISIDDSKYGAGSKANRLRAFWSIEPDILVGKALKEMLGIWLLTSKNANAKEDIKYKKAQEVIAKLLGTKNVSEVTEDEFLEKDFSTTSVAKLKIESNLVAILESRLKEINVSIQKGASLASVILSGSVLEGILLGAALSDPRKFNQANSSPKDKSGTAKPFHEWTLGGFIDVAYEVGLLKIDVKKFSHSLRDFRNYIHPYEQMASGFNPDQHTAKICLQVLKAAIADLSGER